VAFIVTEVAAAEGSHRIEWGDKASFQTIQRAIKKPLTEKFGI
jgi:hypothetical protein